MNKSEIIEKGSWNSEGVFKISIFSNTFNRELELDIIDLSEGEELSNFAYNSINALNNISNEVLNWIRDELWKQCLTCFNNTDFGANNLVKKTNQSQIEWNKDFFKIYNSEQAFEKIVIEEIIVSNDNHGGLIEGIESNYCISLLVPWNNGHRVFVHVTNEKPDMIV